SEAAAEERPGSPGPAGPPTVGPGDVVFPERPHSLRPGSPSEAGLVGEHVERIVPEAAAFMEGPEPSFPGFTVLAASGGVVVEHAAAGHRVRYAGWDEIGRASCRKECRSRWRPWHEKKDRRLGRPGPHKRRGEGVGLPLDRGAPVRGHSA